MTAALWHRLSDRFEAELDSALAGGLRTFHFDDGYDDVLRAADALERREQRGIFFVVSGWLGLPGQATKRHIRELADRGHEIGNHTAHHVWMPKVPLAIQAAEVDEAQDALADLVGRPPTRFAWPYGEAGDRGPVRRFDEVRGISPAEIRRHAWRL